MHLVLGIWVLGSMTEDYDEGALKTEDEVTIDNDNALYDAD